MQRTPNNTVPPGGRGQSSPQGGQHSPAYTMAARIRNEQGKERAAEYLSVMEPFLAPGEREHIARSLELPIVERPRPQPGYQQPYQQGAYQQPQQQPGAGPFSSQAMPFMQQGRGGMGDPMQMLQMLSGLGGVGGKAGGGGMSGMSGNPMMLAQLLGGLMGKK